MTAERLFDLLIYGYPVIVAALVLMCGFTIIAFLQTHRPHLVTATMLQMTAILYFVYRALVSLALPFQETFFIGRILIAIMAAAFWVHLAVAAVEEWEQRQSGMMTIRDEVEQLKRKIAALNREFEQTKNPQRQEQYRYWIAALELRLKELSMGQSK